MLPLIAFAHRETQTFLFLVNYGTRGLTMMKIFLDTSNVEEIRKRYYTGLIDGVTTNPTLMLREGRDPVNVISEIQEIFQDDPNASISAEVSGDTADEMLTMAEDYLSIGPAITIKVPCTVDGLVACKVLSEQDIKVNVTLIFNAAQAILAAKAGAAYVSPFVGRLDDQSIAGLEVVRSISEIYCRHGVQTKILASFYSRSASSSTLLVQWCRCVYNASENFRCNV